ncbi:MAG: hypothetical protein ACT4OI_01750, partial [Methanobacteriota archaeon]
MLLDFPVLSLIVFLPIVGAVVTYVGGMSARAARGIALTFSLVVLGLSTAVLATFFLPEVVSLPPPR